MKRYILPITLALIVAAASVAAQAPAEPAAAADPHAGHNHAPAAQVEHGDAADHVHPVQPPLDLPRLLTRENVERFGAWPIQDQGRVKPMSTFARFELVQLSGRAKMTSADGVRRDATEWLLRLLLDPRATLEDKIFLVENPQLMQDLGLPSDKPRTRFSYLELSPVRDRLLQRAQVASQLPSNERNLLQIQTLNLYQNMAEFESLATAFDFARMRVHLNAASPLRTVFPEAGEDGVPYAEFLKRMRGVLELVRADGVATDQVTALVGQLQDVAARSQRLTVIPPVGKPDEETWHSPGGLLEPAVMGETAPAEEIELAAVVGQVAAAAENPAAFADALERAGEQITATALARGEATQLGLERFFYKANFFRVGLILFLLAFMVLAVSWLAPGRPVFYRTGAGLTVAAWLVLVIGITIRCILRGRPPITTLYETTLFVPAVAIALALFMEWVGRRRIALALAVVIGSVGLFMANAYELKDGSDTMGSLVAVLNSNFWLATHVTTVTIGYSAGLLAAALAHVYIIGRLFRPRKPAEDFKPVARMVYGIIAFTLVFSFVGTVLGGIWANYSWGRFWGWDPKENGALLIVIWCLLLIHARAGGYIRELGMAVGAVLLGMVVAFSWWGVNLLGVGLHSYGFTSGVMGWLMLFWGVESLVSLLGVWVWSLDQMRRPDPAATAGTAQPV